MSAQDLSSPTHHHVVSSVIKTLPRQKIDFSIDGILKVPYISTSHNNPLVFHGEQQRFQNVYQQAESGELSNPGQQSLLEDRNPDSDESKDFSWLYCSRFKPPKLPRSKKRSNRKRYGRGPRIPFAAHQITVLENAFKKSHYLSPDCINRLADSLYLSETRVKIWFQNRRARFRREQEVSTINGGIVSSAICDGKILGEARIQPMMETTGEVLHFKKAKRRRPNVSSCDDDDEDRLVNFTAISPDEQVEMSRQSGLTIRGDIQHFSELQRPASTKYDYTSVSQDLLLNPSGLTAMNHFQRILHGSSSSAFVPLRK